MELKSFPSKGLFVELAKDYNVIPVCKTILADSDTPVSLLRKSFTPGLPLFLLESVEGGEKFGRFSFLGISARYIVKVFKDKIRVSGLNHIDEFEHNNDPFNALREFSSQFKAAPIKEIEGFYSGLVGYMTYEMISFIEKIPNKLPANEPLALFMVPDSMLVFDNVSHTVTLVSVAFLEKGSDSATVYNAVLSRLDGIMSVIESDVPPIEREEISEITGLTPLCEKSDYLEKVEKIKNHIHEGDIIQAVISQPFTAPLFFDPVSLYRAQRYINPSPYLFYFQCDDISIAGSSPETMVKVQKGQATLRPIAGTRPRGSSEQEDRKLADDLLKDEKEKAEHLMLVDLGRNDLGRIAETGSVQVTDLMFIERYSHVMHLVSNIECTIKKEMDVWDVIKACFPAGTLSGAPKVRAMELISKYEDYPRGPYGGAVGYIDFNGNMDFAITIRTAVIKDNQVIVRAGAGIVADSVPETEYEETINKAKSIERAVNLIGRSLI
ncbi:MAG: anthranilate synthase component I family protein [Desulforegulaceae bacterium]|nr:anthranilate synthase component I family protein [Desulforegulaceae bacterium]